MFGMCAATSARFALLRKYLVDVTERDRELCMIKYISLCGSSQWPCGSGRNDVEAPPDRALLDYLLHQPRSCVLYLSCGSVSSSCSPSCCLSTQFGRVSTMSLDLEITCWLVHA